MAELATVEGAEIAALLAPCVVTLVTAVDAQGHDRVATIAWAMPLSHDPSYVGVCIRPGGSTAQAIIEGGCFVVNVLPEGKDAVRAALLCGKKGAGQPERFETAGLTRASAGTVAACRVEQAASWVECEFVDAHEYGDHMLYVGRTLCAQTRGGIDEHGRVEPEPALLIGQRNLFGHFEED